MPYINGHYYPEGNEMTTTPSTTNQARIQYGGAGVAGGRQQLDEEINYLNRINDITKNGSQISQIVAGIRQGFSYSQLLKAYGAGVAGVVAFYIMGELDSYWKKKMGELYGSESKWAYEFEPRINVNGENFEISFDGGNTFEPVIADNTVIDDAILSNIIDIAISDINVPADRPSPEFKTAVGNTTIQIDQTRPSRTDIIIKVPETVFPDKFYEQLNPSIAPGLQGEFPQSFGLSPFATPKTDLLMPLPDFVNGISFLNPSLGADYISPTLENLIGGNKITNRTYPYLESDLINNADLPQIPPYIINLEVGDGRLMLSLKKAISHAESSYGITEENRLRKDKKPASGLLYLSILRLINRTWGKASEALDLYQAFRWNFIVEDDLVVYADSIKNPGQKYRIVVHKGQKLGELPLNAQDAILKTYSNGRNIDYTFDMENFAVDLLKMEMTDMQIALQQQQERALIKGLGLNQGTPLTYGNVTTWYNRYEKLMGGDK